MSEADGEGRWARGMCAALPLLLRCSHAPCRPAASCCPADGPTWPPPPPILACRSWGKLWGQDSFCDGAGAVLGATPPAIAGVTGSADTDPSQQTDGSEVPLDTSNPAEQPDENSVPEAPPADELPADDGSDADVQPADGSTEPDTPPAEDPADGGKADSQAVDEESTEPTEPTSNDSKPSDSKPSDDEPAEEPTKPSCPKIAKCDTVDEATCECTACADGYEPSADGTECSKAPAKPSCPTIDSCKEQDADTCECVRCAAGYEPSADGTTCDEQVDEPPASTDEPTDSEEVSSEETF